MRIRHTIQLITALTTVSAFAACSAHHTRYADGTSTASVEWDSGPLDREYRHEKEVMEARHRDEIARERADESAERREARQKAEREDLEDRYERSKKGHLKRLIASLHDHDKDEHEH